MASAYLDIGPLMAARGISGSPADAGKRHQLRMKADAAGFNVMPNQAGELHVHHEQFQAFAAWLSTFKP